jgi:hypothetical protein
MVEMAIVMDGIGSALRTSIEERIAPALELVPKAKRLHDNGNLNGAFIVLRRQYGFAHTELNTPEKVKELDKDEVADLTEFADTLGHAVMALDLFNTNGSVSHAA